MHQEMFIWIKFISFSISSLSSRFSRNLFLSYAWRSFSNKLNMCACQCAPDECVWMSTLVNRYEKIFPFRNETFWIDILCTECELNWLTGLAKSTHCLRTPPTDCSALFHALRVETYFISQPIPFSFFNFTHFALNKFQQINK